MARQWLVILTLAGFLVSWGSPCGAETAREYFLQGNLLSEQKKFSEAVDAYRRSLEKNPKSAPTHYNLALAYKAMKQNEKAVAALEQAIILDPYYLDAHLTLGNLYNFMERWQDAIAHLNIVVHRRAGDAEAHGNLGWAYLNYKDGPPIKILAALNLKKAVDLFQEKGMTQAANATRKTLEQTVEKFNLDPNDWLDDLGERL